MTPRARNGNAVIRRNVHVLRRRVACLFVGVRGRRLLLLARAPPLEPRLPRFRLRREVLARATCQALPRTDANTEIVVHHERNQRLDRRVVLAMAQRQRAARGHDPRIVRRALRQQHQRRRVAQMPQRLDGERPRRDGGRRRSNEPDQRTRDGLIARAQSRGIDRRVPNARVRLGLRIEPVQPGLDGGRIVDQREQRHDARALLRPATAQHVPQPRKTPRPELGIVDQHDLEPRVRVHACGDVTRVEPGEDVLQVGRHVVDGVVRERRRRRRQAEQQTGKRAAHRSQSLVTARSHPSQRRRRPVPRRFPLCAEAPRVRIVLAWRARKRTRAASGTNRRGRCGAPISSRCCRSWARSCF